MVIGFFFTVSKKLKAKKTQATKKLKHFFGQKLKLPEDFSKFAAKNSSYRRIFQNLRQKTASNRQFNCQKSLVNYVFWCKIDFKHQNLTILPKKSINFCKTQHISKKLKQIPKKLKQILKKTQGIWLKAQCTRGKSLLHPLKKRENKKPDLTLFFSCD